MSISIARSDNVVSAVSPRARASVFAIEALLPALILFYSTLIPMEVRFNIADQTFYPPRIAAVVLLPWLISKLASGAIRFRVVDGLMFSGVSWMIISFMLYYGDAATGFMRSTPLAFDVIIPYLVARITVRDITDLRRFLIYASPGLFAVGSIMALESFAKFPIVKPFAASVFGPLSVYENGLAVGAQRVVDQTRLGLMRASGPFSHPILGGIFLAIFLPLYWFSGIKKWPKTIGIVGTVCGIFSLSSGTFLLYIMTLGTMVIHLVQRKISFLSWRFIIGAIVISMIFVQVLSENGLTSILIRYTLDPATGYYRRLIWEYGSQSVMRHPWVGIGYTDFERLRWMGTSVDHHWLLLAIRHGIVVPIAFLSAFLAVTYLLTRRAEQSSAVDRLTYVALAGILASLVVAGMTVTYFGQMQTMFYFILGICFNQATSVNGAGRKQY